MILRSLTLAAGVSGAAAFSQFPEFSQQYVQRLGGAVDALSQVVADFDTSAAEAGLSRQDALAQMTGSDFVDRRRRDMEQTFERHARLQSDLKEMQAAGPFMRAYHSVGLDTEIAVAAAQSFKPALPLNFGGAVFGGFGYLVGAFGFGALLRVFRGRVCLSASAFGLTRTAAAPILNKNKSRTHPMAHKTAPFSRFEFMIAWRYLRAKRTEGGVSTMTWISLIGITLAVFALIATLAVRSGFRAELVDTILGANAHVTVYNLGQAQENGQIDRTIPDYEDMAARLRMVPGVTRAAPLVKGQVLATAYGANAGVQVYGIDPNDLLTIPRIANPEDKLGDINDFAAGVAIGSGVATELSVGIGDKIKLINPNGPASPFGRKPRVNAYNVTYIFTAGRYDIDRTRVYLPMTEAQPFFDREGVASEIEVMVEDPEAIDPMRAALFEASGGRAQLWTWLDASGGYLRALEVEDNVMFVILSILVLIATMNIISGLIMLVKNKGRDIGILRTMGLTEGSILRVFFLCGAFTGVIGTICGVVLGCLFAIYIDTLFSFANWAMGGGVWDPSIRGIYALPAELHLSDVLTAVSLSLGLSFIVTWFPARRAARMNPVEALRYE